MLRGRYAKPIESNEQKVWHQKYFSVPQTSKMWPEAEVKDINMQGG